MRAPITTTRLGARRVSAPAAPSRKRQFSRGGYGDPPRKRRLWRCSTIYLMATVLLVLFVGCQKAEMADKPRMPFCCSTSDPSTKRVYVIDRSASMADWIDYVKFELKRSIGELGEETEFHVIFYSSGPLVEMPTGRPVPATERNMQLAFEFIDGVIPQGETDPAKALERAFAVGPDVIYLLTRGEFDRSIVDLVKRLNVGHKVTVHTIGLLYRIGEEVLKEIAEQNNGNYVFVSETELKDLISHSDP